MFHPYVKIKKKTAQHRCCCAQATYCCAFDPIAIGTNNGNINGPSTSASCSTNNINNFGSIPNINNQNQQPPACVVLLIKCPNSKELCSVNFCDKR